jgi:hypothetical protein
LDNQNSLIAVKLRERITTDINSLILKESYNYSPDNENPWFIVSPSEQKIKDKINN